MGQYWLPVNLDKKEYINPHELGTGLKLWEQVATHPGTGAALIILCAAQREVRGGGDLHVETNVPVIGRWAGDRIALVGDYADDSDLPARHKASKIYEQCMDGGSYTDITQHVASVIEELLDGKYQGEGWKEFIYNRRRN